MAVVSYVQVQAKVIGQADAALTMLTTLGRRLSSPTAHSTLRPAMHSREVQTDSMLMSLVLTAPRRGSVDDTTLTGQWSPPAGFPLTLYVCG